MFCYLQDIEILLNLVALQFGISNRHFRTKGGAINGDVYSKIFILIMFVFVMREEIDNWWKQAEKDLSAAKNSPNSGDYEWASFQSNQAAEKGL